jgi:hypothetical protein
MTAEEFTADVNGWLAAEHARWNRPHTELVYQPMLEVLSYLRANGYKTYIATRAYSGPVYCIPAEQVAGTEQSFKYRYDKGGRPTLTRAPQIVLDNLEAGKIENFYLLYGSRPYAAFGNFLQRRPADVGVREGRHRREAVGVCDARRCDTRVCVRSSTGIA